MIYKHLDFLLLDKLLLLVSFLIAYIYKIGDLNTLLNSTPYRVLITLMLLISIVIDFFTQAYKNILKRTYAKELSYVIKDVFYNLVIVSLVLFLSKTSGTYSRLTISITYILYGLLAFIFRQLLKTYITKLSKKSLLSSNNKILIVSDSKNIDDVIKNINSYNYNMYEILGLCLLDENRKGQEYKGYKVVTNKNELLSFVCHEWVDEVYFAMELTDVSKEIFDGLATAGITTNIQIRRIEEFEGQDQTVRKLFNTNVLTTSIKARTTGQIITKRLIDIVGGLVGSLITLILTLFIGPIIYIKSPGPIFFKQERIGQNGRRFYMYKFRSMVVNADDLKADLMKQNRIKDGMMFKVKDDPRIIPVIGEFIRKTSLDEFPQFFNVVKGDMSLVGTRPPTVDEWVKYKLEHRIRMAIKPGITGLWQTSGRSKITDFNKVIEYDTKYINNWSLSLDIEILLKTVKVLLSKRDEEAM